MVSLTYKSEGECASESTGLVSGQQRANTRVSFLPYIYKALICVAVAVVSMTLGVHILVPIKNTGAELLRSTSLLANSRENASFPPDFVWGAATSSYQIEGAYQQDGRGLSIWDEFCQSNGTVMDKSNGNIACDHYNRMEQDVALMSELGIQAYRFSISWSRIQPNGTGPVNPAGLAFYDRLINELRRYNIQPWVTLFHWDLPLALEATGGWLNATTVDAFDEYARICFDAFGDRVSHWITINEAWTVAVNGYGTGVHAPGHRSPTEPYIVAHNLLLAHARAARRYKQNNNSAHWAREGVIGMANCGDFRYPRNPDSVEDRAAAERAMEFQFAWLVDPILKGDYPLSMRERLGTRLPYFTTHERDILRNSADFLGLNYYSSLVAAHQHSTIAPEYSSYWTDMAVDLSGHLPQWEQNDMGWFVVPDGLYRMLNWIAKRYDGPTIYITENGSAEPEPDVETAKSDEKRRKYLEMHLHAGLKAIAQDDVTLLGYFAWSLMDNFEWQFGYQRRFGIVHVDFETLQRTPKSSALWYKETIRSGGKSIADQTSI